MYLYVIVGFALPSIFANLHGQLELCLDDPRCEVFSRALAVDLENYNGVAARDVVDSLWADRGLEGGKLLSTWCQAGFLQFFSAFIL